MPPTNPQSVASLAATFVSRYYNAVTMANSSNLAGMFDAFAQMSVADPSQAQGTAHVGNVQIALYLSQREALWGPTKVLVEHVDYVPGGQGGAVLITCYGKFLHRTEERAFVESFVLANVRTHPTHYQVATSTMRILSVSPYQRVAVEKAAPLPPAAKSEVAPAAPAAPAKSAPTTAPKDDKKPEAHSVAPAHSDAKKPRELKEKRESRKAPTEPKEPPQAAPAKADSKPQKNADRPPKDGAKKESFKAILYNVPDGVKKNDIYDKTEKYGKVLSASWFGRSDDHCVVEFTTAKSLDRLLADKDFALNAKPIKTKLFTERE
jgi:hypothetical protein